MKVAVVTGSGVPNPTSGGGALTAYTVVRYLLERWGRVAVVAVHEQNYFDPMDATAAERLAHLEALGVETVAIPSSASARVPRRSRDVGSRLRRTLRLNDEELQPYLVEAARVRDAVAELEADASFVYHFEGLAASRLIGIPRLGAVGDPSHLPALYRWRYEMPSRGALRRLPRLQAVVRGQPRVMAALLRECAASGAFAAHHAAWFREHGVPECEYLRTPVPDAGGRDWRSARDAAASDGVPHLLLLGHLKGIVTVDGLRVFERMLAELERSLGDGGFIVDVAGGYEPPAEFRHLLAHSAVRLHGHADEAQTTQLLRTADILLVPTSIPLGVRVRILTGFSAGACIIAHSANARGIPELVHGSNALLGSSPEALARRVGEVMESAELRRRLEAGARETWERHFAPDVAAARIADILVSIASLSKAPSRMTQ